MNLLEALEKYVKPQTFPVGIKMLERADFPDRVKTGRDLNRKIATCQAIGMARRYGWSIGLTKKDLQCAPGFLVIGFSKPTEYYLEGNLCEKMYTESKKAGRRTEKETEKFEVGEFKAVLITPLKYMEESDIVVIYGNSAQIMRLIQARLYTSGGRLSSSSSGRLDCSDIIVSTLKKDECQYIVPCYGDRVFSMTQDHEMIFTIPRSKISLMIKGLEGTHMGGVRYPIPHNLRFQPEFPPSYRKLEEELGCE